MDWQYCLIIGLLINLLIDRLKIIEKENSYYSKDSRFIINKQIDNAHIIEYDYNSRTGIRILDNYDEKCHNCEKIICTNDIVWSGNSAYRGRTRFYCKSIECIKNTSNTK